MDSGGIGSGKSVSLPTVLGPVDIKESAVLQGRWMSSTDGGERKPVAGLLM